MAMAIRRRPQDQMEIDEIDGMLGEDEPVSATPRRGLNTGVPAPRSSLGAAPRAGNQPTTLAPSEPPDDDFGVRAPSPGARPRGPTSTTQPVGAPEALRGQPREGNYTAGPEDHTALVNAMGFETTEQSGDGTPSGSSAWERYGTGNIPGAEDIAFAHTNMPGFNTGEWGSGARGTNSTKNTFGKIASRYDPRAPNATQQILNDPDFQRFFPEATLVPHPKGDLIDFGDGQPVDVLVNAVEGGSGDAWAFQTGGGGGGAGGATGATGVAGGGALVGAGTPDQSSLAEILAALDAMASGDDDPLVKQQLDALLREASPDAPMLP